MADALANDLLDARGGNVGRNDQGDILLGQRERRDTLDLDRIGGHVRDQRVHVDLEGARARGQAEGAAGGGRELAGQGHVHQLASGAHEHAGDAARVEGRDVGGIGRGSGHRGALVRGHAVHPGACHLDAHAKIAGHATHVLEGVGPVVGARRGQDASGLGCAGEHTADVPGLGRDTGFERGEHLVGGTRLGSGQACGHRPGGTGNLGDLEDGDVRVGTRDVAARDVQQRVEHARAQPRGVVRHRVAQAQSVAARVARGDALAVPRVGHEGVGLDLDEASVGQRGRSEAAGLLRGRQAMAGGGHGQDDGDLVVAVQAGDLLNQVGREGQVGAPRGGGHREDAVGGSLNGAADGCQQLGDALGAVGDAGEALGLAHGQRDDGCRGTLIDVGDALVDGAAAIFDEQLDGALGCDGGQGRVDAALEALGGLGVELVAAGAARDRHRVEVGGLEEDVRRASLDLGVRATHDASDADDAGALPLRGVGDEQVLHIELALFLV